MMQFTAATITSLYNLTLSSAFFFPVLGPGRKMWPWGIKTIRLDILGLDIFHCITFVTLMALYTHHTDHCTTDGHKTNKLPQWKPSLTLCSLLEISVFGCLQFGGQVQIIYYHWSFNIFGQNRYAARSHMSVSYFTISQYI